MFSFYFSLGWILSFVRVRVRVRAIIVGADHHHSVQDVSRVSETLLRYSYSHHLHPDYR